MPAPIPTPDQAERLRGTRVADAGGRPLVLHHGTIHRFEAFGRSRDIGYHFGTRSQAHRRLDLLTAAERKAPGAGAPRIVSVALAALSPLLLPDDPLTWQPHYIARQFRRFLTRDEMQSAEDVGRPVPERRAMVRDALVRAGYDAVVYRNQVEGPSRSRGLDWSWLALDARSIVVLGEDLAADVVDWRPSPVDRPGYDPTSEATRLGGLRRANHKLASAAEMRRFRDAGLAICGRLVPDATFRECRISRASVTGIHAVDGRSVAIEITGEIARLRLRVEPAEPGGRPGGNDGYDPSLEFVEAMRGLDEAHGFAVGRTTASPVLSWSEDWAPGEPMEAPLARFEAALEDAVGRLHALAEARSSPAPR